MKARISREDILKHVAKSKHTTLPDIQVIRDPEYRRGPCCICRALYSYYYCAGQVLCWEHAKQMQYRLELLKGRV